MVIGPKELLMIGPLLSAKATGLLLGLVHKFSFLVKIFLTFLNFQKKFVVSNKPLRTDFYFNILLLSYPLLSKTVFSQ